MTNKRLRNDIIKIFENYSKQLLTDFVNKHQFEHSNQNEFKDRIEGKNNQTLTEDEFDDSDLSEGEIILNSRSSNARKQNQETQTDLDCQMMNEFDFKKEESKTNDLDNNLDKKKDIDYSTSDSSSDDDLNKKQSSLIVNRSDKNEQNNQQEANDKQDNQFKNESKDQSLNENADLLIENNTFTIEKSLIEQTTQTELCLDDLKNVHYLKEIRNLNLNELKDLMNKKERTKDSSKFNNIIKKDASNQTLIVVNELNEETTTTKCTQCSLVQNLLIEFQNKIDRIDSSIVQREDSYVERINVLQEENNRLQIEIQKIIQIKDELLNQKDKEIIDLNNKIVDQKEKIASLDSKNKEEAKKEKKKASEEKEEVNYEKDANKQQIDQTNQLNLDQTKMDKQSIDSQLAILNKNATDSTNQKGLINILETIIKCLQARIEHKDEAIAHYQQLLTKTQEEHQQEIQKLMKNYKKVTEHSIKAIQSSSNVNQEQLESTLTKYNEQLNEFKSYHQKIIAEQKKAFEIQSCKMRRLKTENERLKNQASTTEELSRLRNENEYLNRLVEKNVKFIEKLKNAIKEERSLKQESELKEKQEEPSRLMQINKLKEETENLYKLLISKDKQIKELQINKWNLEKKINEVIQTNKAELKAKTEDLEKMMNDQVKLRSLFEKLEKEKSALRRKQITVIKENKNHYTNKEVQTDKFVNFNDTTLHQFKQLDQTISTLKTQLQQCAQRENELISMLEMKGFERSEINQKQQRKEFSIQTIKGKKLEIRKQSCDF